MSNPNSVKFEFFGIPRRRAGVAEFNLVLEKKSAKFGDLLAVLASEFPGLANDCIQQGGLGSFVTANLDGEKFISDPNLQIRAGQSILLLSADAGG